MMMNVYLIIISFFVGLSAYAQGIQLKDADPFPMDKNDNQYGFSNETGYIFNPSKNKTVQIIGKNYYDTPSLTKKDKNGEVIWKKVLIPSGDMWLYQLLLTKDEHIYVAGTLTGKIRIPTQNRKYAKLKANENTEEGNPFLIKFDLDGKVLWVTLLADDKDSYRIFDHPPLTQDKKTNQLIVKTEIRHNGGEDIPYMLKTFTVDPETGKVIKIVDN